MGIATDFLVKHVRPYGLEALAMLCGDKGPNSLWAWLIKAGVPKAQIQIAYNAWARLAMSGIDDSTIPEFEQAAWIVSQARWCELYNTPASTVMYLNGSQLTELSSLSGQNASQNPPTLKPFDYVSREPIGIAVTIRQVGASMTNLEVSGARLAADAAGNCSHFEALIL